ncbi:metallophosphoesterase [Bulleidia sp. zg-1006]|uniref:metallophosphoesterase n=1 Tax=Bulleidia sp. zg-1006 TaxID=2806552 RepID=UPI00193A8195|nr:metallophosphoesterase [Bulleidia sp. zg-1006]QRG86175.1 fructose-bisphosphatase class III [Bulleidia sp. zg-1006]
MSTYVMSDLHGCYDEFLEMLDKIHFNQYDHLYINGDICDRGPKSIPLLQFIMAQSNMTVILGNHDVWLRDYADYLIDLKNNRQKEPACYELRLWMEANGGASTIDQFLSLSNPECYDIKCYLESLNPYQNLKVQNHPYSLVHAGLGKEIKDYHLIPSLKENTLVWCEEDLTANSLSNSTLIVGHVPTFIYGKQYENHIIHTDHDVFHIDGGCVFGRCLLCLRLDDQQEFSVPSKQVKP